MSREELIIETCWRISYLNFMFLVGFPWVLVKKNLKRVLISVYYLFLLPEIFFLLTILVSISNPIKQIYFFYSAMWLELAAITLFGAFFTSFFGDKKKIGKDLSHLKSKERG